MEITRMQTDEAILVLHVQILQNFRYGITARIGRNNRIWIGQTIHLFYDRSFHL